MKLGEGKDGSQASSVTNPPAWTHLDLFEPSYTKGSLGIHGDMSAMLIIIGGDRVQSKVNDDTDDGGQDWASS